MADDVAKTLGSIDDDNLQAKKHLADILDTVSTMVGQNQDQLREMAVSIRKVEKKDKQASRDTGNVVKDVEVF